ncbi:MAG: FAD-dependent monooxygenase, partial [Ilumatobacter sp.]
MPASPSTATDTPIEQIDTLIVGAGPAGAAAAITLAAAGRSATVIDRSVFPRDKCCGDGLTTLALRELELLGVTPEDVPNWMTVDSAHLRSPSGRSFDIPLPGRGIYAAVAPRADLDNSLVLAAASIGADIRQGWRLDSIRQSADSVHIGVTDGEGTARALKAHHVIAADGMW